MPDEAVSRDTVLYEKVCFSKSILRIYGIGTILSQVFSFRLVKMKLARPNELISYVRPSAYNLFQN
jgi:hypothetical protein